MLRSSRGSDGSAVVQQYNTEYSFRLKKFWWTGRIADKPPVNVCDQKHPLEVRKIDVNQQLAVVHMGTVASLHSGSRENTGIVSTSQC
jgi:hypothetical protein